MVSSSEQQQSQPAEESSSNKGEVVGQKQLKDVNHHKVSFDSSLPMKHHDDDNKKISSTQSQQQQQSRSNTNHMNMNNIKNPKKFGKADLKRDIFIFIGIMGIFFYIAFEMDPMKSNKDKNKKRSAPISDMLQSLTNSLNNAINNKVQSITSHIEKYNNDKENKFMRHEDCDLYLYQSSIPISTNNINNNNIYNSMNQYSLYAGKNYSIGDTILIPSPVSIIKLLNFTILLPSYLLFIKHHPTISNIRGKLITWVSRKKLEISINDNEQHYDFTIKATSPITIGDELIIDYTNHIHSILLDRIQFVLQNDDNDNNNEYNPNLDHDNKYDTMDEEYRKELYFLKQFINTFYTNQIPLLNDYQIADTIMNDMIIEVRKKVKTQQMKVNNPKNNLPIKRAYNSNEAILEHTKYIFHLIKRSISYINPIISSLLPNNYEEFHNRFKLDNKSKQSNNWATSSNSIYEALHNISMNQLKINGICLNDIQYNHITTSSNDNVKNNDNDVQLLNRQHVKQGQVITKIPLLIVQKDDNKNIRYEVEQSSDIASSSTTCRQQGNDNEAGECEIDHQTLNDMTSSSSSSVVVAGNQCYGTMNHSLPIVICPLNIINDNDSSIHIPSSTSSSSHNDIDTIIPNVEYSFDFQPMNNNNDEVISSKKETTKTKNDIIIRIINKKAPVGIMQLVYVNVIAIQDIRLGEKVNKEFLELFLLFCFCFIFVDCSTSSYCTKNVQKAKKENI